jgi:hypothetical protein
MNKEKLMVLYVSDFEEEYGKFQKYLERREGSLITLKCNHAVINMKGGGITEHIREYTGIYRKDGKLEYCYSDGYETFRSSNDWQILLIDDDSTKKLYMLDGKRLVFFPDEAFLVNIDDFLVLHYKIENYNGVVVLSYKSDGSPVVFSDLTNEHYGHIYAKIIDNMGSIATDFCTSQTLNTLLEDTLQIKLERGTDYEEE